MKITLMMVLCSAAILASGCASAHSHATAWEYKVVDGYVSADIESKINALGHDGWVVVSSASAPGDANTPKAIVILKRHK